MKIKNFIDIIEIPKEHEQIVRNHCAIQKLYMAGRTLYSDGLIGSEDFSVIATQYLSQAEKLDKLPLVLDGFLIHEIIE
jgi:hypothetical protein